MRENTSRVADDLPDLHVGHRGIDWPSPGTELFDLSHAETATFFWARSKPSRAFLRDTPDINSDELYRAIPMGYATLDTLEKVAIVADDRELRVWPHSEQRAERGDLQPYQLILPPGPTGYLRLGASWPFRYALADATALSARTGDPVLVARVLSNINWH